MCRHLFSSLFHFARAGNDAVRIRVRGFIDSHG